MLVYDLIHMHMEHHYLESVGFWINIRALKLGKDYIWKEAHRDLKEYMGYYQERLGECLNFSSKQTILSDKTK